MLDPNVLIYIPYPRVNCLKTIPFTVAHTYIAHIWQYPPPPFPTRLCGTQIKKDLTLYNSHFLLSPRWSLWRGSIVSKNTLEV